jgi:hypothetical protein
MELFDIIPQNFFSILSSKNKRLYTACAMQAFAIYETGSILGIDRKLVVDELTLYLDNHDNLFVDDMEEFNDNLENPENNRDTANLVLRRLEECGWIYIDLTADYTEILNFTDVAITMIEALQEICPQTITYDYYNDDDDYATPTFTSIVDPNEYKGYIYTIYSLLSNEDLDYPLMISEVYKNTKLLIRSLRKMDSRIKDYINSVVETSEIKDLMKKLMEYNEEIYEPTYTKLKTADNINKYRLKIVTKLESISSNKNAMEAIAGDYMYRFRNPNIAMDKANRDIDEMVDIFNELDDYITGIDEKNKNYINSTIGKVKFLLTEEDNIIGKLNTMLKYIKKENKDGKIDRAMTKINTVVNLPSVKGFSEASLYTPRGKYVHGDFSSIDLDRFDFESLDDSVLKGFKSKYDPAYMTDFVLRRLDSNNSLEAKSIVDVNGTFDEALLCIYVLIYASEHQYKILKLDDEIQTDYFKMANFRITREEQN